MRIPDDDHAIEDVTVHESVSFWPAHWPSALLVIIVGRADLPSALAVASRPRRAGRGATDGDLWFTSGEAGELLAPSRRRAHKRPPPSSNCSDRLGGATEGWAAGLQLAALSLRGRSDVTGFMDAFTGSHRYVLDYLAEEVLERQEPGNAPLPVGNLGTRAPQRLPLRRGHGSHRQPGPTEQVERAGLFLAPLDDIRRWWRYHHLFSDLLRAQLGRDPRGGGPHRRAAAWYEDRRLADDAIHHALAAGDDLGGPAHRKNFDTLYNLRGRERRSVGGWPRCPTTSWPAAPGCCWLRPKWPPCSDMSTPWNHA